MLTTTVLKHGLSTEAEVIERGDEKYDDMRRQFGYYHGTEDESKAKVSPERIVVPANEADVQTVVKLASLHGYAVVVRSGGHSYTATSSTNGDKTIQLDMKNFTRVMFEEAVKQNTIRNFQAGATKERYLVSVEPGVKLAHLNPALAKYNCVIPMGICMNVAAGGHFQSSGYGMLLKNFGYGVEYVSSVKLVLASGEIINASRVSHPELFWALRGGSPGAFGVALEYEIEAINAFNYEDISYGCTLVWDYSEERANEILKVMFRLSSSKEYSTRKNMIMSYTVTKNLSDFSSLFFLSPKDKVHGSSRYKIVVNMLWCGVDGGSIYNKIPDSLREEGDSSSCYYDYYVGALKSITTVNRTVEFLPGEDRETALLCRLVVAQSYGQDSVGRAKHLIGDLKLTKHVLNMETALLEEENMLRQLEEHGIDLENEEIRHSIVSRHSKNFDFSHAALIETYQNYCHEAMKTGHSALFSQISFTNNVPEPYADCALQSFGKIKVDIWFQWRNSSPVEVVEKMKRCSAGFDNALTSILQSDTGNDGTLDIAFPMEQTDLSCEHVRKQYYPDHGHFQKLQEVKRMYDPSNVFRTQFTVPPADTKLENHQMNHIKAMPSRLQVPREVKVSWFEAECGKLSLTLVGRMEHHAKATPHKPFFTWIAENGDVTTSTFLEFRDAVVKKASWLCHNTNLQKGDRVVVCFLPGYDFFVSLMACCYLGVVSVPCFPSNPFSRGSHLSKKVAHIVRATKPKFILGDRNLSFHRILGSGFGGLASSIFGMSARWIVAGEDSRPVSPAKLHFSDPAVIQYTSGTTTSAPMGAILTHGNIFSQIRFTHENTLTTAKNGLVHVFHWLPHWHDLGLFLGLGCLFAGIQQTSMSPAVFMKHPLKWFEYMAEHKATHTAAPNFSFSLCLDRISKLSTKDLPQWDLSTLRVLNSGGDPIDYKVMEPLLKLLERHCKLQPGVFSGCYGNAEHASSVTMHGKQMKHIDLDALHTSQEIKYVPSSRQFPSTSAVHSCGPIHDDSVRIVGSVNATESYCLGEDRLGEIWLSSNALAREYVEDESTGNLNRRLLDDDRGWFATGDLGFIHKKELFVIGRAFDMVSVDNKKIFPVCMEQHINTLGDFRKGSTIAYSDDDGSVHVALERKESGKRNSVSVDDIGKQLAKSLRQAFSLSESVNIVVHFIPPRSSLRTTSGKVERLKTAAAISSGKIVAATAHA